MLLKFYSLTKLSAVFVRGKSKYDFTFGDEISADSLINNNTRHIIRIYRAISLDSAVLEISDLIRNYIGLMDHCFCMRKHYATF